MQNMDDIFKMAQEAQTKLMEAQNGLDKVIDAALHGLDAADPPALMGAAANIRAAFATGVMAPALRASLAEGYRNLGEPPVAVRSSATAEDLPDLSFAGQQDTFLNVRGVEALYRAVVQCWSSLWTGRAIAYRARNGIEQADVALAVVVQVMVPAQAAGVLFTANPLTGRRTEMAIDATLGLGEALVSGEVEPDHYVVDPARGVILHKTLGAKDAVIAAQEGGGTVTRRADNRAIQAVPDAVILQLAALGSRVELFVRGPRLLAHMDAEVATHLQEEMPRLQDMFTGFVRELRPEDLSGSAGTYQLRAEILRRVNMIAAPGKVDAVLIEEMLVQ